MKSFLISRALPLTAALFAAGCASPSRLSVEMIQNAPYTLPEIGTVRFVDGAYDRESGDSLPLAALHVGQIDLCVFGDLDGDRREDAITFLSRKGEGPELYISMEAFLNKDGRPAHAASYRIGDRVAIDSVTIDERTVHLYIITQGPDDAVCCPTLHVHRKVILEQGQLTLSPGS